MVPLLGVEFNKGEKKQAKQPAQCNVGWPALTLEHSNNGLICSKSHFIRSQLQKSEACYPKIEIYHGKCSTYTATKERIRGTKRKHQDF